MNDNKILHDTLKRDYASKEEVREMIRQYRSETDENKKNEIRDTIFLNNIRHIRKISSKLAKNVEESEDLFQNGVLGFFDALEKFDLEKETAFITYLYYWVYKYILEEKSDFLISIPKNVQFMNYSYARYNDIVENNEVAENKDYLQHKIFSSDTFVNKYLNNHNLNSDIKIIRLDTKLKNKKDAPQQESLIIRDDKISPEDSVFKEINNQDLISIIKKKLNVKESQVILLRYFSDTDNLITFKEIVDVIGTSVQRVEQIEKKALRKLKKVFLNMNR